MENPYNQVPYQGSPFPQAHINRLATHGKLLAIEPPPVASCRVLELGCGEGAHLIPMAMEFPESQFVGVDLAESPIARATDLAKELGLSNITFRVADVAQLGGQPGECDYLLAHGLFSWVPAIVQDKILELAGRLLAPTGLAYISYNAYPAWHMREMTRNISRMRCAGVTEPAEIRNRTIALLATIYRTQAENDPYRETVRAEMERLIAKDANLCFHDDFGDFNLPVYFSDFIKRAEPYGLQYLNDAEPMNTTEFAPDTLEMFNQVSDLIEREQLYDLLTMRGFRRTILCRNDLVLHRDLKNEQLRHLHFSAALKLEPSAPDLSTFAPAQFVSMSGSSITVNQPFVKAVLWKLSRTWPGSVNFEDLMEQARSVAPLLTAAEAEEMVREVLVRLHLPGILEISIAPYKYATSVSERPSVSKLVRMQSRNGSRVTSLRHRPVDLDDETAKVLTPLLDGSRSRDELAQALPDAELTRERIDEALQRLLNLALLES